MFSSLLLVITTGVLVAYFIIELIKRMFREEYQMIVLGVFATAAVILVIIQDMQIEEEQLHNVREIPLSIDYDNCYVDSPRELY